MKLIENIVCGRFNISAEFCGNDHLGVDMGFIVFKFFIFFLGGWGVVVN